MTSIALDDSWDSARCISLGKRYEKGLAVKVDMTSFDVQNLSPAHPCFQCHDDDFFSSPEQASSFPSSPASNLLSLPFPTLGNETIDIGFCWRLISHSRVA